MYTLAILLSPAMEAYKCELLVSGGGCSGVVYYVPTSLDDQGQVIVRTTPASESRQLTARGEMGGAGL